MRHLLLALAAVAIVAVAPVGTARAQSDERITNFATVARLSADSSLDVTEIITYDFGATPRHGIYRDIPLKYTDDRGTEYRPTVSFRGASQDGNPATVGQTSRDGILSLKLGDAARTLTGSHVYRIHYVLSPIMQPWEDRDEFRFNVTGNGWNVPIERASLTLTLPSSVAVLDSACYTGLAGSKENQCLVQIQGNLITVATAAVLAPAQGLGIVAELPTGAITGYLTAYVPPKPSPFVGLLVSLANVGILVALVQLIVSALAEWRLRTSRTIVAEYEAPDGLKPAELGLLTDNKSGMPEITATLIDLAVRGHLRIEQTHKKDLFHAADYTFHKLSSADSLEPYEQKLIDALFGGSDSVVLKDIDRTAMAATVTDVKNDVGDRMKGRGWYFRRPSVWRWGLPSLLLATNFFGLIQFVVVFFWRGNLLIIGPVVAVSLLLSGVVVYLCRRPSGMTPAGADEWAKVRGFKEYLSVAEKARLDFSDAPEKTPERFNKLLPFAIALGVEKAWAKQFEGIDVAPASGWYGGYDPATFSAVYLASSLGSDFSSGVASNFTPVSSSGGAGGGFSGGGFGGGGGGSW